MANIAVLVPRCEMLQQAREISKRENISLQQVRLIQTADAVQEALASIAEGAQIIVARGLQARLIKAAISAPLVEIRLTGQEIGLLIAKAKQLIHKKRPHIAVIGFENTYSDMSHFEELFEIQLSTFYVTETDELQAAVEKAKQNNVDIVIGGDRVSEAAERLGLPSLFNEATGESVREALLIAEKAGYAIDLERHAASQLDSIMETSLDGIIRLDAEGRVTAVNEVVRDVLRKQDHELLGAALPDLIDRLDNTIITALLNGEERQVCTVGHIRKTQMSVTAASVEVGGQITGVIVTLHQMGCISLKNEARGHDMYLNGFVAGGNFSHVLRSSKPMKKCIELAQVYALSRSPVVIFSETGTETELFAQAIHNSSARRNQPYVSVSCYEVSDAKQTMMLFREGDEEGAVPAANLGTLHISDIHNMTLQSQHRLLRLISQRVLLRNDIYKAMAADVRIIVSTDKDLAACVQQGSFRKDLYYKLQSLVLTLPPLRETPTEIEPLITRYTKQYMGLYSKYVVLSKEAMKVLAEYAWHGNLVQLEQFCELLVLTAQKRTLNDGHVRQLLAQVYPEITFSREDSRITVYRHPENLRISQLLKEHGGNRTAVAKALGISTTTLWRRIKKYGVEDILSEL